MSSQSAHAPYRSSSRVKTYRTLSVSMCVCCLSSSSSEENDASKPSILARGMSTNCRETTTTPCLVTRLAASTTIYGEFCECRGEPQRRSWSTAGSRLVAERPNQQQLQ